MNDDLTHVTAVLDASGSMSTIKSGVIEGFNDFFREQADVEGEMTTTLYEFSSDNELSVDTTNAKFVQRASPVRQRIELQSLNLSVPQLTEENYNVGGLTPLYDALVHAIDATGHRLANMDEEERPANVIVLVLTDGKENASTAGVEAVRDRIEEQQNVYDWEFLFIGANQDAIMEGGKIGINAGNAVNYTHSDEGAQRVMMSTTENVTAYRESGGDSDQLLYDEGDQSTTA